MRSSMFAFLAALSVASALPQNLAPRSYGAGVPYGTGVSSSSAAPTSTSSQPGYRTGSSTHGSPYSSSTASSSSSATHGTMSSSSTSCTSTHGTMSSSSTSATSTHGHPYSSSTTSCSSSATHGTTSLSSTSGTAYPHHNTTKTWTDRTTTTSTSVITETITYPVTETKTTLVPCSTAITSYDRTWYSTYLSTATHYTTYTTTATKVYPASSYPAVPTPANYENGHAQCSCPAQSYITVTETVYSTPTIQPAGPVETITVTLINGSTTWFTVTKTSTTGPTSTHKAPYYPPPYTTKTGTAPYHTGETTHSQSHPTVYSPPPYTSSSSTSTSSKAAAYTYA